MPCLRHPSAARPGGLCSRCLLEYALPGRGVDDDTFRSDSGTTPAGSPSFTVQVPLGRTPTSEVFLVRGDGPEFRLMRLKRWYAPAPEGFLALFETLVARCAGWDHGGILLPFAATVDTAGRPAVLSDFRRGVPLLARVRAGRLGPREASEALDALREVMHRAHARGLAHGSLVPGNVLVDPQTGSAYLLDFGLAAILSPTATRASLAAADLAGFKALARSVTFGPLC
jgi:hypothetical protein